MNPWEFMRADLAATEDGRTPVPHAATAKGELTLSWSGDAALGGNGRGCQVSEVWLIKESAPPVR